MILLRLPDTTPKLYFMQSKKDEILFRDTRFLIGAGMIFLAILSLSIQYQTTI